MKLGDLRTAFADYANQCEVWIKVADGRISKDFELVALTGVPTGGSWLKGNNGITQVMIAEHGVVVPKARSKK